MLSSERAYIPTRTARVTPQPSAAAIVSMMPSPECPQRPVYWIETIKVRLSRTGVAKWQARIDKLLAQVPSSGGELSINLYRPISVPNDVLIVLHWSTPPCATGSALAFRLCRDFKSFALVDHAVWEADCFGRSGHAF